MNEPATVLAIQLGAELPASTASLPESVFSRLLDQLHTARRHQAEIVDSSGQNCRQKVCPCRFVASSARR